jgi:predicted component of type VI protein secretion system
MKRTTARIFNFLLSLLAVLGIFVVVGCQSQQEDTSTKETLQTTTKPQGATNAKGGQAAIPDVEPYAAPPGVKTGLEGGRK